MTMEQRQAGHQARWDNSISTGHYMLVGGAHNSQSHQMLHIYRTSNCFLKCIFYFYISVLSIISVSVFSVLSFRRRDEGDSSSHKQAIQWRLGGLCVPLHTLHWLSLSTGGGCCWRQEHQYLLQLENGFSRWKLQHGEKAPRRADLSSWNVTC